MKRLFDKGTISSAIIFYGIVLFYTLYIDVKINVEMVIIILFFTVLFWLANSLNVTKKEK